MMEIVIKIPKEFEEHFNSDRFEDSLQRCRCDIKRLLLNKNKFSLSGKYEIELLDMLTDAFEKGTPLPEHHGRLIDENDLKTLYGLDDRLWWGNAVKEFTDLPTIIEADKESAE